MVDIVVLLFYVVEGKLFVNLFVSLLVDVYYDVFVYFVGYDVVGGVDGFGKCYFVCDGG